MVASIRQNRNAEPLLKQRYFRDESAHPDMMLIGRIVNTVFPFKRPWKTCGARGKEKEASIKRSSGARILDFRLEHYDLINEIAQPSAGIGIGQLLRGDVKDIVKAK